MDKMWKIIEKTKSEKTIEGQCILLENILSEINFEECKNFANNFIKIQNNLCEDGEFLKLHYSNGGIVDGGDDSFFEDFACWFIMQGKDLYNKFKINGYQEVINYINDRNVEEDEYLFENVKYYFPKKLKYSYTKQEFYID